MSDVKRWKETESWGFTEGDCMAVMRECNDGEYVLYSDYARLKADYEVIEKHLRFHIEQESLRKAGEVLHQQNIESGAYNREKNETIERLKTELERLRKDTSMMLSVYWKHYERLRKAGDAMEDAIIDGGLNALNNARDEWHAAKEGKQP